MPASRDGRISARSPDKLRRRDATEPPFETTSTVPVLCLERHLLDAAGQLSPSDRAIADALHQQRELLTAALTRHRFLFREKGWLNLTRPLVAALNSTLRTDAALRAWKERNPSCGFRRNRANFLATIRGSPSPCYDAPGHYSWHTSSIRMLRSGGN